MSSIDRQHIAAVKALKAVLAIAPGFELPTLACLGLMDVLGGVVRPDGVWQRPHPFKSILKREPPSGT
jgi:hypothetical protein